MRRAVERPRRAAGGGVDRRQPLPAAGLQAARAIVDGDALASGDLGGLDPGQDRARRRDAPAARALSRNTASTSTRAIRRRSTSRLLAPPRPLRDPPPQLRCRSGSSSRGPVRGELSTRSASRANPPGHAQLARKLDACDPRRDTRVAQAAGRALRSKAAHLVAACLAAGPRPEAARPPATETVPAQRELAALVTRAGQEPVLLADACSSRWSDAESPRASLAEIQIPEAASPTLPVTAFPRRRPGRRQRRRDLAQRRRLRHRGG